MKKVLKIDLELIMNHLRRFLAHVSIVTVTLLCQSFANGQVPDLKPKDTGSISGRVTMGSKPAPGILVTVTTSNLRTVAQATTDADGNFHAEESPAWHLSHRAARARIWLVPSVDIERRGANCRGQKWEPASCPRWHHP